MCITDADQAGDRDAVVAGTALQIGHVALATGVLVGVEPRRSMAEMLNSAAAWPNQKNADRLTARFAACQALAASRGYRIAQPNDYEYVVVMSFIDGCLMGKQH